HPERGTHGCLPSTNRSGWTRRWRCSVASSAVRPRSRGRRAYGVTTTRTALVKDEPVVVHCYTTPGDIEDTRNLAALGEFCRKLGREAHQGEVGLIVDEEYFAIRDFSEGGTI